MKEKRTYKRVNFIALLAILGCVSMLLFEGIFVFELYDRAVDSPKISLPSVEAPVAVPSPVIEEPEPSIVPITPAEDVSVEDIAPAQIKTETAVVPVG